MLIVTLTLTLKSRYMNSVKKETQSITIGELAKRCNVSKVAIRYYEKRGLLSKVVRRITGYRIYSESTINKLHFIKNAQSVGFTLKEIGELLMLQENEAATSKQIKAIAVDKLETIQNKINSLKSMTCRLTRLVTACNGKIPLPDCPILLGLYELHKI